MCIDWYFTYPDQNCPQSDTVVDHKVHTLCYPAVLTRGDTVDCRIWLDDTLQQLTIVNGYSANASYPIRHPYPDSGGLPLRQPSFWHGTAVVSTTIVVNVKFRDSLGTPRSPAETLSFTVTPRTFSRYSVATPPPLTQGLYVGGIADPPIQGAEDNGFGVFRNAVEMQLFKPESLGTTISDTAGPNAGLHFWSQLPPLPDTSHVWIYPGLYPYGVLDSNNVQVGLAWWLLQDGDTTFHDPLAPGVSVCDSAHIIHLQQLTLLHEAFSTDPSASHYGVYQSFFTNNDMAGIVERQVQPSDSLLRVNTHLAFDDVFDSLEVAAQHLLDREQGGIAIIGLQNSGSYGVLHCKIRYQ